jgi:hypothetical protein
VPVAPSESVAVRVSSKAPNRASGLIPLVRRSVGQSECLGTGMKLALLPGRAISLDSTPVLRTSDSRGQRANPKGPGLGPWGCGTPNPPLAARSDPGPLHDPLTLAPRALSPLRREPPRRSASAWRARKQRRHTGRRPFMGIPGGPGVSSLMLHAVRVRGHPDILCPVPGGDFRGIPAGGRGFEQRA